MGEEELETVGRHMSFRAVRGGEGWGDGWEGKWGQERVL